MPGLYVALNQRNIQTRHRAVKLSFGYWASFKSGADSPPADLYGMIVRPGVLSNIKCCSGVKHFAGQAARRGRGELAQQTDPLLYFGACLNIKAEVDDVALLHDVVFAFETQ